MMHPRTVEDVIMDFKGRRAGMIKALTKDFEEFYHLCDPNNPNLCLYSFPDQQWIVNLPPPSDLPEPRIGINFVRDTMKKHDWLSMVALHSDAWLCSVASYFATKFRFDKADRKRLFNKIADFTSISEVVIEGKSARKRGKTEGGGLPKDILVEEVLAKLPVRDLLKCRSVSKVWRSLIDDPNFVSTHLKNYKNNSEVSHLLVNYRPARSWVRDEQVLVRRGDTFRKVMVLQTLHDQCEGTYNFDLICYINGLMLVRKGNSWGFQEIVLWNPSLNRCLKVPNPMFEDMKNATYFELGLGYDAPCNDYKVIVIVYPHAEIKYSFGKRYRATTPGLIQVYTLGTNSWSSNLANSPPPYWSVGQQVFLNGAIHWINYGPNVTDDLWFHNKDLYIAAFDVENEVFEYFELPSGMKSDDEPKEKFPTVLGGFLAIFCAHNQSRNDIWLMGEYGVSNSWSKCYTFTLHFNRLLHFKSNGELLFAVDWEGIKSYDVKRERVKDLAKTYSKSSKYAVYTYMESLVLFNQVKKRPLESSSS